MPIRLSLTLALLAAPTVAIAQDASDPIKSAEQITCEITNDCDVAAQAPAATRTAAKTRGFRVKGYDPDKKPDASAPYVKPKPVADAGRAPKPKAKVAPAPDKSTGARLAVGFETGSFALTTAGRRQADQLLAALKGPKLAGKRVLVSGHTDSVGDRAANLELSRRRAEALVDYLAANGVERARLEAKGYGFDKPIPGLSPRAAAQRRVEIALVG